MSCGYFHCTRTRVTLYFRCSILIGSPRPPHSFVIWAAASFTGSSSCDGFLWASLEGHRLFSQRSNVRRHIFNYSSPAFWSIFIQTSSILMKACSTGMESEVDQWPEINSWTTLNIARCWRAIYWPLNGSSCVNEELLWIMKPQSTKERNFNRNAVDNVFNLTFIEKK